jgi:hypothetical protein
VPFRYWVSANRKESEFIVSSYRQSCIERTHHWWHCMARLSQSARFLFGPTQASDFCVRTLKP